jgi:hypothetical protein
MNLGGDIDGNINPILGNMLFLILWFVFVRKMQEFSTIKLTTNKSPNESSSKDFFKNSFLLFRSEIIT